MRHSPVLWSCYNLQLDSLKAVLRHGALVKSVDKQENTCFHKAILRSGEFSDVHEAIFDTLIGEGADINQPNNIGYSPLYLACQEKKPKIMQYLLDLGAAINYRTPYNSTVLMEACCQPDTESVKALLKRNPDLTIANNHGLTALTLACVFNQLENVKALINHGARVTVHDRERHTPLYAAIHKGNIEIGLEILATPDYFPECPATERAFTESSVNVSDVTKIENILLQKFEEDMFTDSEQLPIILHWAIANGASMLAQRCISHDQQVLKWERNGATWLHITAQYGYNQPLQPSTLGVTIEHTAPIEIDVFARAKGNITALYVATVNNNAENAQLLLQMIPEQTLKVKAIIDWNSEGESPLTISIKRGHKNLEILFWDEICKLGTTNADFMESNPSKASEILELLAQYETPGREAVLNKLLQLWFGGTNNIYGNRNYSTLEWAVNRSQVTVLWWLLSKGGYSSGDVIARALKLIPDEYPDSDVRYYIKELLRQPPPILDTVANPNTDRITLAPVLLDETYPSLQAMGTIVDIYSSDETVNIPYTRASVRDIVYDEGPESLMAKVQDELGQHGLNVLKMRLKRNISDQRWNNSGHYLVREDSSSPNSARPELQHGTAAIDERLNRVSSNLRLRWIHLPVNEDLVCRLSHDSNRLELDHSALMNHFNRSWTELAAGGKQNYMKPQCVIHPTGYSSSDSADSRPLEEGFTCTALYVPYLILGSHRKEPEATNEAREPNNLGKLDEIGEPRLEESIESRNSRKILHEPMTLDQYYYPTIADTDKRDNDQVLSKFLRQQKNTEKTIFKVNNLWIWIIDEKTIITATAEGPNQDSQSNLLRTTLNNILYGGSRSRFERATTVESVMELILGVAVGSFMEKSIPVAGSKKGPIDVFRESIRNVTDEETHLFEGFLAGLKRKERESGMLQRTESWLNLPEGPLAQNRYHIISSETELLHMTRDIYDELQILKSLAEEQDTVWKQAFSNGNFQHYHYCTPADIKNELDEIIQGTEQAADNINTLLDLRQAEYSRIQAHDSAKQSNTVLVFTLLACVFLPLSFLTSLFALDVSTFPHPSGELRYEGWWLFPILFGVTVIVSTPAILFAWNVNMISGWWLRLWTKGGSNEKPNDDLAQRNTSIGLRRRLGVRRRKLEMNGSVL
ncbi:hypothetical protein GGR51DRAFT_568530 [Nemania sp. FL0031]|nr:hypothetical protein GGR51DRAFT_568530 [Nemania sp. FL0031]